jgi:hypothetical protein
MFTAMHACAMEKESEVSPTHTIETEQQINDPVKPNVNRTLPLVKRRTKSLREKEKKTPVEIPKSIVKVIDDPEITVTLNFDDDLEDIIATYTIPTETSVQPLQKTMGPILVKTPSEREGWYRCKLVNPPLTTNQDYVGRDGAISPMRTKGSK